MKRSFLLQAVIASLLLFFSCGVSYAQETPPMPSVQAGYHLEGCILSTSPAPARWTDCRAVYDRPVPVQQQPQQPAYGYPYYVPPPAYYYYPRPALVFRFGRW